MLWRCNVLPRYPSKEVVLGCCCSCRTAGSMQVSGIEWRGSRIVDGLLYACHMASDATPVRGRHGDDAARGGAPRAAWSCGAGYPEFREVRPEAMRDQARWCLRRIPHILARRCWARGRRGTATSRARRDSGDVAAEFWGHLRHRRLYENRCSPARLRPRWARQWRGAACRLQQPVSGSHRNTAACSPTENLCKFGRERTQRGAHAHVLSS